MMEMIGIRDVSVSVIGRKNYMAMVHATVSALLKQVSPEEVARREGRNVFHYYGTLRMPQ